MAFSLNGSAADQDALMSDLMSFCVTNGWTQDDLDLPNNEMALHKDSVFVSISWASGVRFDLFQALGFTGGQPPGNHPDDSGHGGITTGDGMILLTNNSGPYTYDFFSGSVGTSDYIHAAIEIDADAGRFVHLSFGEIEKVGDWTGGEYIVPHAWGVDSGTDTDPTDIRHVVLFDAQHGNLGRRCGTIHMEGLPNMTGAQKWGVIGGNIGSGQVGNDSAGEPRELVIGGIRDGYVFNSLQQYAVQPNSGAVPLQAIQLHMKQGSEFTLLGFAPDIRGLNITNFNVREEVLQGSDTWRIYPWTRKTATGSQSESGLANGLAIKKVP